MPAAIAIPAIAGVVGAGISAGTQIHGQRSQSRAANQALKYEQSRERDRRRQYQEQLDAYRRNWHSWYARYGDKGIDRWGMPRGIEVPAPGSQPARPGTTTTTPTWPAPGAQPGTPPLTASGIATPPRMMPPRRPRRTLGDIIGAGGGLV